MATTPYYGGYDDDYLSEYDGDTDYPPDTDGFSGKDVMYGGGGSDILDGARNDDELHGGANPLPPTTELEERLYGQTGDDKLYGEDGPDDILGQQGTDLMSGGAGDDTIDAVDAETVDNPDTVRCGGGFDLHPALRSGH